MKKLPKSIAIVGGAATGCQLASIFNAFGTQVSILELAPKLLRIEDDIVTETIETAFVKSGIEIITGISGVERIERTPDGTELFYTFQGEVRGLMAEAIFLSTGWLGNLDPLNLTAAGVEVNRNYVRVDDFLQTSAPHIFAAGDITGRMMLVQSAGYEALAAAENGQ